MKNSSRSLKKKVNLTRLWVFFLAILAVHNVEENILGLPRWANRYDIFNIWTAPHFMYATLVVWCFACLLALLVYKNTKYSSLLLLFATILLGINALQHCILSIVTQSIMPGVVSALLLVVPFGIYTIRVILR